MRRSGLIRAAVAAITTIVLWHPALAQRAGDHWVVTWSTAGVGRPQIPAPAPPPAPPPAPFMHFTTRRCGRSSTQRRRIADPRRAQQRVRHRAADHRRRAHRAARQRRGHRRGVGQALTFSGQPTITIPAGAVLLSDPVDSPCRRGRPRDRSVPARHHQRAVAAHDARRGAADQLHLGNGQPRGQADAAGGGDDAELVPAVARRGRWRPTRPAPSSRSATRSPTARGRRPTRTAAGRIVLARRLLSQGLTMGVLNAGIGGNRVLSEAAFRPASTRWRRFDARRASSQAPASTHVIVLEGINDIGNARAEPDADAPRISSPPTSS